MEWFENLQTVFDESKVLNGAPGKNVTIARRKGKEWFVGAMTNNDGSKEEITLDFLDKDRIYLASVYTDEGDKVKTRTQVACSYWLVDASTTMKFDLKPAGGAAVRLVPVRAEETKGLKRYKGKIL